MLVNHYFPLYRGNGGDYLPKCIYRHLVDVQQIRPMVQFPGTLSKYATSAAHWNSDALSRRSCKQESVKLGVGRDKGMRVYTGGRIERSSCHAASGCRSWQGRLRVVADSGLSRPCDLFNDRGAHHQKYQTCPKERRRNEAALALEVCMGHSSGLPGGSGVDAQVSGRLR